MRIYRFLIILLAVALAGACVRFDVEEILLERQELSLTWKGEQQISYDPLTWQVGCNLKECEYRVHDDSMANYFVIKCSERPSVEGMDVIADVEWTVRANIKRYEGLRFTVRKIDSDGMIWLWCKSQKIGVVVKEVVQD